MQLRYGHVELALAGLMNVAGENIGAFRARLRHLRNIGVPQQLPKPGSGQPIAYSRRQALEMLIALELEKLGQAPKRVMMLAGSIVRQAPYGQYRGKDCYVMISEKTPGYTMASGVKSLSEVVSKSAPEIFL